MGDRLATIDMGRKWEVVPPFFGGGTGSPSNTVAWAEAYLHTKCRLNRSSRLASGHNGYGPKIGGVSHFLGGGEQGPHLTQCGRGRGLPPYQVSS